MKYTVRSQVPGETYTSLLSVDWYDYWLVISMH